MNKGMVGYSLVFVLLIVASLVYAGTDQITPNVAHSQGELTVGVTAFTTVEKVGMIIFKLVIGTVVSSALTVAVVEGWKRYKQWSRNENARRWNPGPNARWQQGTSTRTPSLKREDLMLLALMNGRMPANSAMQSRLSANRTTVQPQNDQPIELEF